jgi:Domain of unknown function (DUF4351)
MTQTPFDQMSKQYLEEFLAPFGTVQRQYEVPGEAKFVDVWFIPAPQTEIPTAEMGILGRMAGGMCLLEPYRSPPTRNEIRSTLMKLIWVQEDEQRKAKLDGDPLSEDELPKLWILATSASKPLLQDCEVKLKSTWVPGVYFMAEILKTAIVAIDELPETPETLWVRILGRDETQERAIREVLALPIEHPRRSDVLRLLASWKVRMDLGELMDFVNREEGVMALSEAFLEWEQATESRIRQEAERSLIILQLEQRVGALPQPTKDRINTLSLPQIESLAIALLNFSTPNELEAWLDSQAGD